MNDHNPTILLDSFDKCMIRDLSEDVVHCIQDLELLIERHIQQRYEDEDYKTGFHTKSLYYYRVSEEEADRIVHFLVYLLFNFPDRAGYTAHAIKKCYGYDLLEVCCCGIRIYMNQDDFATINLMEFLFNNINREEIFQKVWDIFNEVLQNGLPYSVQYLKNRECAR